MTVAQDVLTTCLVCRTQVTVAEQQRHFDQTGHANLDLTPAVKLPR